MKFNEEKRILTSEQFIAPKDKSDVYGHVIYLGIYDSPDNYTEVSETEKNEILKAKETRGE